MVSAMTMQIGAHIFILKAPSFTPVSFSFSARAGDDVVDEPDEDKDAEVREWVFGDKSAHQG